MNDGKAREQIKFPFYLVRLRAFGDPIICLQSESDQLGVFAILFSHYAKA